ncbi:MAG TPA: FtsX-like permease family protein [Thermoanaerobaculia bacterium]|nr:FtsX-like permease family protein [Thermoanaerobaculia bacterium]
MLLAFKNLARRALRTSLSVLGVAVGVGAIVAFTAMGEGFKASIDRYGRDSGADLVLVEDRAGDPAFGRILAEELDAMRALPDVRGVSASLVMPASLPGRAAPFLVLGRDLEDELLAAYRSPALRGRLLEGPREIMLGEIAAEELGKRLGDRVELFGRDLEVVGIFRTGVRWENGGAVVDARLLREQLTMPERSAMVAFVYLSDDEALPVVTLHLQGTYPRLRVLPTAFLASGFEQLAYVDAFIWVISLAALIVGAIGVLNTMLMNVSERVREIGTLRAFGWPKAMVMRLILGEGLVTSILGGIGGSLLGVVAAELLMELVPQGILAPVYGWRTFGRGMAVAIVLGVLGALYPAWRASRLAPAEALRYE